MQRLPAADPHELQNLATHPGYENVRDDLAAQLIAWMDETDDPLSEWVSQTLA